MCIRFFWMFLYAICLPVLLFGQQGLPKGWSRKVIPDCRCTVIMPESATKREMETQSVVGKLQYVSWVSTDSTDRSGQIYFLSWVDYPDGTFSPDSLEAISSFLSETLNSHQQQLNGNLVYNAEQSYDGFPGILFRMTLTNQNRFVKGRMMIKGNRFYLWQVFAPDKKHMTSKIEVFLDQAEFDQ